MGPISKAYVLSLSGALVNTLWTKPVRLAICFSIASIRSRRWSLQKKMFRMTKNLRTKEVLQKTLQNLD